MSAPASPNSTPPARNPNEIRTYLVASLIWCGIGFALGQLMPPIWSGSQVSLDAPASSDNQLTAKRQAAAPSQDLPAAKDGWSAGVQPASNSQGGSVKPAPPQAQLATHLEPSSFDFGKIYEGEKVTKTIKIFNDGPDRLLLGTPNPSCGCATAPLSRSDVAPGGFTELRVSYNSAFKFGPQKVQITIPVESQPGQVIQVDVHGLVITEAEASPRALPLGNLQVTQDIKKHVIIVQTRPGDKALQIVRSTSSDPRVSATYAITPDSNPPRYDAIITIKKDARLGPIGATLQFFTNLPHTKVVAVTVYGNIVKHLVVVNPQLYLPNNNPKVIRSSRVQRVDHAPFILKGVRIPEGAPIKASWTKDMRNVSHEIAFHSIAEKDRGSQQAYQVYEIVLETDVPDEPEIKLRINVHKN